MKKMFLFLAVAAFFVSCLKSHTGCEPLKPSSEEAQIVAFAATNDIIATKDSSGIYYQVIENGMGANPTVNSTVTVSYTGKYLNGSVFDQSSTPRSFKLGGTIEGWRLIIPRIKKGGRIKMVIPSAYAYGCTGYNSIPPNEILYFDVTLVDVQ